MNICQDRCGSGQGVQKTHQQIQNAGSPNIFKNREIQKTLKHIFPIFPYVSKLLADREDAHIINLSAGPFKGQQTGRGRCIHNPDVIRASSF